MEKNALLIDLKFNYIHLLIQSRASFVALNEHCSCGDLASVS